MIQDPDFTTLEKIEWVKESESHLESQEIRDLGSIPATVAGRKMEQVSRPREKPSLPPPWTELPRDITANILQRLGAIDVLKTAQRVCKTWRSVCKDPSMWRVIDMHNHGDLDDLPHEFEMLCRHAVDRSQGLLVDISLGLFVTNELLLYISQRSRNLRRLRLESYASVDGDGLIEAVKNLPLLEELEWNMIIFSNPNFNKKFDIVGRSCPLLRTFGFNYDEFRNSGMHEYVKDNEDAFAIARNMPELRHLQLHGNSLTNEGLEAIINGCPHLESLDLRRCYYVRLNGDLVRRLSAQIKCMTYPAPDHELQEVEYASSDDGNPFWLP